MPTLKVILPPAPLEYDRQDQNALRFEIERALSSSYIVKPHAPQHYEGGDDPLDINQLAEMPLTISNLEADAIASRLFLVSDTDVLEYSALEVGDLPAHAATHQFEGSDELSHNSLPELTVGDVHTQYVLADGTRNITGAFIFESTLDVLGNVVVGSATAGGTVGITLQSYTGQANLVLHSGIDGNPEHAQIIFYSGGTPYWVFSKNELEEFVIWDAQAGMAAMSIASAGLMTFNPPGDKVIFGSSVWGNTKVMEIASYAGSALLSLQSSHDGVTGRLAQVQYAHGTTVYWNTGKNTDHDYFVWDAIGNIQTLTFFSNGDMTLSPAGGTTNVTGILAVTGALSAQTLILGSNAKGSVTDIKLTDNCNIATNQSMAFFIDSDDSGTADTFTWNTNAGFLDGEVELMELTEAGVLTITGALVVGDGGTTHYTQFDTGGFQTMHGTALNYEDIRVPMSTAKRLGNSDPDWELFADDGAGSTGVHVQAFAAGTEQELEFTVQIPHAWSLGTNVNAHVHWSPSSTDTGDVTWKLEFTLAAKDGTFGNTTTLSVTTPGDGTDRKHQYAVLGDIDLSSFTADTDISIILTCRVYRDVADGDDYADDAFLHEVDFHMAMDTIGSRALLTK